MVLIWPHNGEPYADTDRSAMAQYRPILSANPYIGPALTETHFCWCLLPVDSFCFTNTNSHWHFVIAPTGDIISVYRKSHLFDVELPEKGVSLKESAFTIPGPSLVSPVQTPIGKVSFFLNYHQVNLKIHMNYSCLVIWLINFHGKLQKAQEPWCKINTSKTGDQMVEIFPTVQVFFVWTV